MIIGLDYDNTFSADPYCFTLMIRMFQAHGHQVVMVTGRSDEGAYGEEVRQAVGDLISIVFAGGAWKRVAAREAGYNVDIWIDDNPEYIDKQYLLYTEFKEEQTKQFAVKKE